MKEPCGSLVWPGGLGVLAITLLLVLGQSPARAAEEILFEDKFDTDTSGNWTVLNASDDGVEDFTAEFNYDYAKDGIPAAPNSGGTTRGVKLGVNKDDSPAFAALNLYPKGRSFTGNYALRFDLWLNYAGGAYGEGASGTTEFAIFGLNHLGTQMNWAQPGGTNRSDGLWFAVTGEGGSLRDYRAYVGGGEAPPGEWQGFDAGFQDRDGDGEPEVNVSFDDPDTYPLRQLFPAPTYESPGVPGKHWVRVEVAQQGSDLTWSINGNVIATRPNTTDYTTGNVMLGLMDILSSKSPPENFVIYDNVQVVRLEEVVVGPPEDVRIALLPDGKLQISFVGGGQPAQYRLQSRADLGPRGQWTDETGATIQKPGERFQVVVERSSSLRFFRIAR
jgi:hypothetical protein